MNNLTVVHNKFLSSCTYILNTGKSTVIIDPGSCLDSYLSNYHLKLPVCCFLTHAHVDHFIGLKWLKSLEPEVFIGNRSKEYVYNDKLNRLRYTDFNFNFGDYNIDFVNYEESLEISGASITFYSAPGHSRDSAFIVCNKFLFSGDVINPDGSVYTRHKDSDYPEALRSIRYLQEIRESQNLEIKFGHY